MLDEIFSFGYWVRRRRKALDLTQAALAREVGCAVVTIRKIEYDERRPSRTMAARLADCLGIPEAERETFIRSGLGEAPALGHYEFYRQILANELGIEPAHETSDLYEGIRRGSKKSFEPEIRTLVQTQLPAPPQPSIPLDNADYTTAQEPALFVGRARELGQLEHMLERSQTGQGQIIFITGEPGQGKTSLMTAFARKALEQYPQLLVLQGNCNAFSGQSDPYLPFREVLNQLTGDLLGRHSPFPLTYQQALHLWEIAPGVMQLVVNHGPYLVDSFVSGKALLDRTQSIYPGEIDWFNALRAFVDLPRPHSEDLPQSALFEQYTNVLRALSAERPLMVLLDDLQWADQGSLHLMAHLAQRLAGVHLFLVGTYRPEEIALRQEGNPHPLLPVMNVIQRLFGDVTIDLQQAGEKNGRDFVAALLDSEPNQLGDDFREQLFIRTQGHPLFTVELLQAMQERGDLVYVLERGWVVGQHLNWDHLPARVEAVISARVDRLDEHLQEILSIASVEGEVFTAQVVSKVKGISERALFKTLTQELSGQHHLVRESGEVEISSRYLTRYQFSHSLFQEYFYNQLGAGERRLLHGEVATTLESLYKDRTDHILAELAYHFTVAGWGERAVTYLQRAGEAAGASYANEDAVSYFSQALNLIPNKNLKGRYDLLLARESVYSLLGNRVRQLKDLDLLDSLAERLGQVKQKAEVALRRANYALDIDDHKNAIRAALLGISLAQGRGDLGLAARGYMLWGLGLSKGGDFDPVISIYENALSLSQQADIPEITAQVNLNLGFFIIYYHRDFTTGKRYLDEAMRFHQTRRDQIGEARVIEILGKLYSKSQGDHATSLKYLEQSLNICTVVGDRYQELSTHSARGGVFLALGDYARAEIDYATSLQISREINSPQGVAYSLLNLGNISREMGLFANAIEYHEQALKLFRKIDEPIGLGYTLTDMGDVFTQTNKWKKATECLLKAIEIREAMNQPHMAMESRAGLARVALAQGKSAEALHYVDVIIDYLDTGYLLDGTEQIFRIYLTCYQALLTTHEIQAKKFLESTYEHLLEQAGKITDQALQQSFLENIPWHREIVQLWADRENGE